MSSEAARASALATRRRKSCAVSTAARIRVASLRPWPARPATAWYSPASWSRVALVPAGLNVISASNAGNGPHRGAAASQQTVSFTRESPDTGTLNRAPVSRDSARAEPAEPARTSGAVASL